MEEKNVFKMSAVAFINVPVYDEISVKNIIEMVKEDQLASSYLPDQETQRLSCSGRTTS